MCLAKDGDTLAASEGVEALLNTFVEIDTLVILSGKKPMEVTTQLIKETLSLQDEVIKEPKKKYTAAEEIAKQASMHQVKDVPNPNIRA